MCSECCPQHGDVQLFGEPTFQRKDASRKMERLHLNTDVAILIARNLGLEDIINLRSVCRGWALIFGDELISREHIRVRPIPVML